MFRRLRPAAAASLGFLALLATGCATMTVGSFVERQADFTRYRTYEWGPADALPTGDPRLDGDPFFKDHLQGAVERRLAARGWELSSSGPPDLLIHYHANVSQRIDVNRVDQQYGLCYGDDCSVRVMEYEAGTIVLDIVDARTKRVVWRGWAQESLPDMVANRDRMARTIDEAVARMLERLPRTF